MWMAKNKDDGRHLPDNAICLTCLLVERGALIGQKVVGYTAVALGEALVVAADGVALDLKAKAPDCLLPALCLDEVPAGGRPLAHAPEGWAGGHGRV
jgi:hypothetical protein